MQTVDSDTDFLARLLAPLPLREFFDDYWEKRCYRWFPSNNQTRDLFTLADGLNRLRFSPSNPAKLCIIYKGQPLRPENYTNSSGVCCVDRIEELIASGASLTLNHVYGYSAHLRSYLHKLSDGLDLRIGANFYHTPPASRGLNAHYDSHSIFVTQIEGEKRWELYGMEVESPIRELGSRKTEFTAPEESFSLRSGEVLYLPRGVAHVAYCEEVSSSHLTIGLHPENGLTLLRKLVDMTALQQLPIRKTLPQELRASAAPAEIGAYLLKLIPLLVEECEKGPKLFSPPVKNQGSINLERSQVVSGDTKMRVPRPLHWERNLGNFEVKAIDGTPLLLVPACAKRLDYLSAHSEFSPKELPGSSEDSVLFCDYMRINGLVGVE